jgi:hypothetical protein
MGYLREDGTQAWPDTRIIAKLNQIKEENPKSLGLPNSLVSLAVQRDSKEALYSPMPDQVTSPHPLSPGDLQRSKPIRAPGEQVPLGCEQGQELAQALQLKSL